MPCESGDVMVCSISYILCTTERNAMTTSRKGFMSVPQSNVPTSAPGDWLFRLLITQPGSMNLLNFDTPQEKGFVRSPQDWLCMKQMQICQQDIDGMIDGIKNQDWCALRPGRCKSSTLQQPRHGWRNTRPHWLVHSSCSKVEIHTESCRMRGEKTTWSAKKKPVSKRQSPASWVKANPHWVIFQK